ncbi:MAG TPA: M23 family metallopeptidase [Epulopiscium sp.]|nr:M23 family metallopeptidase [Candidatus Epulonipiscium sp.]
MLKNKKTFKEFIQGNGFYVITGIALMVVVVTAMVLPRKGEGSVAKEPEKYADNQQVVAAEDLSKLRIPTIEPRMDQEDELEESQSPKENTTAIEIGDNDEVDQTVAQELEEEIVSETFSSTTPSKEEIFHGDNELFAWPVEEQIIYGYSDNDTGSSFMNPTLDRTMRSFGLFLKAEQDAKVTVAGQGKVIAITNYPTTETPQNMDYPQVGLAVIVDHGNDWKTVYGLHTGQAVVQVGDVLQAGDVIGTIGKPSKDFSVTGTNLYFQMLKNDLPVNPKDMLK